MSRTTVTLTAPNGVKVRTVRSKMLFVVDFGELTLKHVGYNFEADKGEYVKLDPPEPFARVVKRTDSYEAALAALRKNRSAVVFRVTVHDGDMLIVQLDRETVEARAASAKATKAFAARVGNNGEARRLFY